MIAGGSGWRSSSVGFRRSYACRFCSAIGGRAGSRAKLGEATIDVSHLTVLCDLDGTLIDSAPAVLESLAWALNSVGVTPHVPLQRSLIGPPLDVLISLVIADADRGRQVEIAQRFREYYDATGCLHTVPYAQLEGVVRTLRDQGNTVFVVTNKRARPTHRILEHLGIAGAITAVYCADSLEGARSKTDVARALLRDHDLDPALCIFVGDSEDDANASRQLGMRFVLAAYGYGDERLQGRAEQVLHDLRDLPSLLVELERSLATHPDRSV
jgi:phosphoglycolate phosphatase